MPTVDLSKLPVNAQQELLDFYEFLQDKYAKSSAVTVSTAHQQQSSKADFKTLIMSIPKLEGIEFERQKDYPKDIEL